MTQLYDLTEEQLELLVNYRDLFEEEFQDTGVENPEYTKLFMQESGLDESLTKNADRYIHGLGWSLLEREGK